MFFYFQPHTVSPGPFTGKDIFPLNITVYQFNDGFLVAHLSDYGGHIRQPCQFASVMAAVACNYLIAALRVGPDNGGLPDAAPLYPRRDLLHRRVVVPYLIRLITRHDAAQGRIAFEIVHLGKRQSYHLFVLFGRGGGLLLRFLRLLFGNAGCRVTHFSFTSWHKKRTLKMNVLVAAI